MISGIDEKRLRCKLSNSNLCKKPQLFRYPNRF